MKDKVITIDDIDLFVFDFDGVLTDNIVHIDNNGNEMVSCSRADGLAFDVLRKLDNHAKFYQLKIILSFLLEPIN